MRLARILSALLLVSLLGPLSASATTVISISGSGDLQITASGDLYFATDQLDLLQIDLYADQQIVAGLGGFTTPTSPDAQLDYPGVSGTTVLDVDDDVYLVGFTFQGAIDFRAANIYVSGPLVASGSIQLATGWTGSLDPCSTQPGVVLLSGSSSGTGGLDGCTAPVLSPPPSGLPLLDAAPVPEPGAALLFAVGAGVVGARIRQRR